jgi:hypothetical protein
VHKFSRELLAAESLAVSSIQYVGKRLGMAAEPGTSRFKKGHAGMVCPHFQDEWKRLRKAAQKAGMPVTDRLTVWRAALAG